jgi:hypothetical protein
MGHWACSYSLAQCRRYCITSGVRELPFSLSRSAIWRVIEEEVALQVTVVMLFSCCCAAWRCVALPLVAQCLAVTALPFVNMITSRSVFSSTVYAV